MIIVSACLLGINCRYDGRSSPDERIRAFLQERGRFIPVCPEQLGGLSTPRPPAVITSGDGGDVLNGSARLIDSFGTDVTEQFLRGAREALKVASLCQVERAVLKERSPSCGVHYIKRNGEPVEGMGVTTALFREKGITVISSERFEDYVRRTHHRE